MAILEASGLVKYYGRRKVVDGVSYSVDAGEVVGLLGPNGAGKTTSFRMTTGQITPYDGRVVFNGQDVTRLPMYRRARAGMGYLSQEQSVFRKLTVEQNILAVLEMLPKSRSLGRPLTRAERWDRTEKVIDQFGLTEVRNNKADRCSGGEKRRLEIARCLVCEPNLILLDEPFAGVDPLTKADIRQIVRGLVHDKTIGILLTDHDVHEVLKITDRSYLIKDGKVRTQGTPQQLVRDPIAIREYLGTSMEDTPLAAASVSREAPPSAAAAIGGPSRLTEAPVHQLLENERIYRTIEQLRDNTQAPTAVAELVRRGAAVIPDLLAALERRDAELRRRAFMVLQHICGPGIVFDPHAPEAQRLQQIAVLRDRFDRGRQAG
ncbi:MAG TPA: LPS export ABC transporter ATP-binding protein [Gemmataceae bacterium]|jgi:lipopolysaccharide export system ATP-binding protein|nr:LPS export ABC transporter ATP-binding protein [Gemmataceae bacterium]